MGGVQGAARDVVADREASRFLGLNDLVVAVLADRLVVGDIDEERPVALVWLPMVHGRGDHHLTLAKVTFAARLAIKLLLPQSIGTAPNGEIIERSVRALAATLCIVFAIAGAAIKRFGQSASLGAA